MAAGDPLARLRARLDRDCLQHLREHCAEQAQRIDELERELRYTQDVCDQWRDEAEALREHVIDAVGVVGLCMDGTVRAMPQRRSH